MKPWNCGYIEKHRNDNLWSCFTLYLVVYPIVFAFYSEFLSRDSTMFKAHIYPSCQLYSNTVIFLPDKRLISVTVKKKKQIDRK